MIYHLFAVLDEATSSLSEEDELSLYSTLSQLSITVLSIGHRSTLQKVGILFWSLSHIQACSVQTVSLGSVYCMRNVFVVCVL